MVFVEGIAEARLGAFQAPLLIGIRDTLEHVGAAVQILLLWKQCERNVENMHFGNIAVSSLPAKSKIQGQRKHVKNHLESGRTHRMEKKRCDEFINNKCTHKKKERKPLLPPSR